MVLKAKVKFTVSGLQLPRPELAAQHLRGRPGWSHPNTMPTILKCIYMCFFLKRITRFIFFFKSKKGEKK